MKSVTSQNHELFYSNEVFKIQKLAEQLPDLYKDLELTAIADAAVIYEGIPFEVEDADDDAKVANYTMSYSSEQHGEETRSVITIRNDDTPVHVYTCNEAGKWELPGTDDGKTFVTDLDMISIISASIPKPSTAQTLANERAYLDSTCASVTDYIEDVAKANTTNFEVAPAFSTEFLQFNQQNEFEACSVELIEVKKGKNIGKPDQAFHVLSVKRPGVRDDVVGTEHLSLACSAGNTVSTNVSFESKDYNIPEIEIEDAREFLDQMKLALDYLLEVKNPFNAKAA